jgi:hypothetical protein
MFSLWMFSLGEFGESFSQSRAVDFQVLKISIGGGQSFHYRVRVTGRDHQPPAVKSHTLYARPPSN